MDFGSHCTEASCGILDFLPFLCRFCDGVFCHQHRFRYSHQCIDDDATSGVIQNLVEVDAEKQGICICRVCSCLVNEQDMDAHLSSACKSYTLQSISTSASTPQFRPIHKSPCSQTLCLAIVPKYLLTICECGGAFCLSHRAPLLHFCIRNGTEIREKLERKKEIIEFVEKRIHPSPNDSGRTQNSSDLPMVKRPRKYNPKLELTKMRMKGVPGLQSEKALEMAKRVFLKVLGPKEVKRELWGKVVYFGRDVTIGRALDALSTLLNVKNENNEQGSGERGRRLDLFGSDGRVLEARMKVGELVDSGRLISGGVVVLERGIQGGSDDVGMQLDIQEYID